MHTQAIIDASVKQSALIKVQVQLEIAAIDISVALGKIAQKKTKG